MVLLRQVVRLLAAHAIFATLVQADPTWFSVWTKQPTNADSVNKVQDLLAAGAAKTADGKLLLKEVAVNHLNGNTKATWYWWVKIEKSIIQGKEYQDLLDADVSEFVDIQDLIDNVDNNSNNAVSNATATDPTAVGRQNFLSNPSEDGPMSWSDANSVIVTPPVPGFPTDDDVLLPDPPGSSPNDTSAAKRRWVGRKKRTNFVEQTNAPRQLRFISLSKGVELDDRPNYKYDANAGKGARVFTMDTGLNLQSDAWRSAASRETPRFLFAGFGGKKQQVDLDLDNGHGTCMSDLAAGATNGVAKEVALTAVQIDDKTTQANRETSWEAYIEGLSKVVDNIDARGKIPKFSAEKHVLSMSFGIGARGTKGADVAFLDAFFEMLQDLDKRGVGLVASMRNNAKCKVIPCGFASKGYVGSAFEIPNLIAVGSGRIDTGDLAQDPNAIDTLDKFTAWAPGDDQSGGDLGNPGILCAAPGGQGNNDNPQGGNSHAAAFTAGLMAYHMGNGLDRDDARKLILDSAYKRTEDARISMIFNAVPDDA